MRAVAREPVAELLPTSSAIESYGPLITRALKLHRSGGLPKGSSTGWAPVDKHYTVGLGQWTVVTGVPGSGKSEWLDALLVNLAEKDGWVFAIYSPENYPTEAHLIKLCEKRARKPFGEGPNERMTEKEFGAAAIWVCERFMWMNPTDCTPESLIELGAAHKSAGQKFGVVLDPWNTLDHERGGASETDYISRVLTKVTHYARNYGMHIWLVAHPQKITKNRDGERSIPTPYDISGSAHWYNKADCIITVNRDQANPTQLVEIHVQKVRFKNIGSVGLAELRYDRINGRYFESDAFAGTDEWFADPERGHQPPAAVPIRERQPGEDYE